MSSKCLICGNPSVTGLCDEKCAAAYGERERIIKLLRGDNRLHNTSFEEVIVSKGEQRKFQEVCVPFCPGCEAIALIKERK